MEANKDLPHLVFERSRHGKQVVYFRRGKGPRVRLPDATSSEEFLYAYDLAAAIMHVPDVRHMPRTPIERRKQKTEDAIKRVLKSAKDRARQKGLAFDLRLDDLLDMAEEQDFRCALTGIEFFAKNESKSRVNPYTPSIDRRVPALGYVRGNVRLVVFAVNAMLLDWGEEFFIRVANSYRYWGRRTKRGPTATHLSRRAPHPDKTS